MVTSLIVRKWNAVDIRHRAADRYIDATAMCRAYGKRFDNYLANDGTRAFLEATAARLGGPVKLPGNPGSLIEVREGRRGGTWVHPRVAIHLAQWLSPEFAALVAEWMEELLTTGKVELAPAPAMGVYTARLSEGWRMRESIPAGHWTVFEESAVVIRQAEQALTAAGLPLDKLDLIDGSIGRHYSDHRRGKPWARPERTYPHRFPEGDPRGTRFAKAYQFAELPHFRAWLASDYEPRIFGDYVRRKHGPAALAGALPHLHHYRLAGDCLVTLPVSRN